MSLQLPAVARLRLQESLSTFSQVRGEFARKLENSSPDLVQSSFGLITRFEELSAALYQARAMLPPNDPLRRRVEEAAAEASQDLLSIQRDRSGGKGQGYDEWVKKYRAIWRENGSLFLFTVILFLISAVAAWSLTVKDPSTASAILPQHMIEDVLEGKKWFESIESNPVMDGISIALNNIRVAINCFVLGSILGLGGLLILSYNGIIFGGVLGFCYANGFDDELMKFVTGHGVLEMTIIVASAFASFLFGRVFYMRPRGLFRRRMAMAASDAGIVLTGIVPWLILAACIEVGVSPWPQYSMSTRITVGLGVASLFWAWTLWPEKALRTARIPLSRGPRRG